MPSFSPDLSILPLAQRRLWLELKTTPDQFTLYGGTAIALRLGHRQSVDFDFLSAVEFEPGVLPANVRSDLIAAVGEVDLERLPALSAVRPWSARR